MNLKAGPGQRSRGSLLGDYPVKNAPACRNGVVRSESPDRLTLEKPHEAAPLAIAWHVEQISGLPLKFDGETPPLIEESAGGIDGWRHSVFRTRVGFWHLRARFFLIASSSTSTRASHIACVVSANSALSASVSVLKVLESPESLVIQGRRSDSWRTANVDYRDRESSRHRSTRRSEVKKDANLHFLPVSFLIFNMRRCMLIEYIIISASLAIVGEMIR